MNRENLWNDPYHASDRTWMAYHSGARDASARTHSVDAIHEQETREAARRQFVMRSRETTRQRFDVRRKFNTTRSRARTVSLFAKQQHRRQDVCSGMTNTIGGDVRDLPYKALRNIMTPLIEDLDTDAADRLQERLEEEQRMEKELEEFRAKRRWETLEDLKMRQKSFDALEKLSGIVRPRSPSSSPSAYFFCPSKRTEELAKPRERKALNAIDCLDGLELTHVSNPEVIETLHAHRA